MQRISIMGNVGGDAEVKETQTGREYMEFSVAVTQKYGENTNTTWYRCVGWDERFLKLASYIKKGDRIFVEGQPQVSAWSGPNGDARARIEVRLNFIEFGGGNRRQEDTHQQQQQQQQQQRPASNLEHWAQMDREREASAAQQRSEFSASNVKDDDLPF